jgi:hypothetical protein
MKKKSLPFDIPIKVDLHGLLSQQRQYDQAYSQGLIEGDQNAVQEMVKLGNMVQTHTANTILSQVKPVVKGLQTTITANKQLVDDFNKIGQYPYVYVDPLHNELKPASSLSEIFSEIETVHSEKLSSTEATGTAQIRAKHLNLQQWNNFKLDFKNGKGSTEVQIYPQFKTGKGSEIHKNFYQTRVLNGIVKLPTLPKPKITI